MTKSIGDVLAQKDFGEPPEIKTIKNFVKTAVGVIPSVSITNDAFIVVVPNSSVAGALRFKLLELQRKLETQKRIILRIR